jgi:hypothetical protein
MTPQRIVERVSQRVVVNDAGCWIWQRSLSKGYGQIGWHENGEPCHGLTHRIMFEALVGPIPGGLQLDHLCHDPESCKVKPASSCPHRACCNPAHLTPGTARQNVLRSASWTAVNAAKVECPSGHPYGDANTYFAPSGFRQCRTCRKEHVHALRRRLASAH